MKTIIPTKINRKIGRAMHDYSMLADGDKVLVAVSGGIDSLVLAWILNDWQRKAPICYHLLAVHIDMDMWCEETGVANPVDSVREQVGKIGLDVHVEKSIYPHKAERDCFSCSKLRRKQIFDLASRFKCNKIAFGHHMDDLLETFFINMFYSGNISTMVPKQQLFAGNVTIVRPLSYLEKVDVVQLGRQAGLHAVANLCPLAGDTRREKVRVILENIYNQVPGGKKSLFAALGNIREGYML